MEAFGEEGKAPSIPAPLIRVLAGTTVRATIRNVLPDSTIHVIGFATQPIAVSETLHVAPGTAKEVVFRAGAPGTYLYRAVIRGTTPTPGVSSTKQPGVPSWSIRRAAPRPTGSS